MPELVANLLATIKEYLATKIGKFNYNDEAIYGYIEEMMTKIRKQIDVDNDSIKEIKELKDRLNESQEIMVNRVNKLTELESKMKELF